MPGPTASSHKVSVCLLASHPLAMAEFQRLFSRMPYRVQFKAVEPSLPDTASIPHCRVYVIDSESSRRATENLVLRVVEQAPGGGILLIGRELDENAALAFIRLGVKGVLTHAQLGEQLERALQSVAGGGYWLPRTLLSRFINSVLMKSPHRAAMVSRIGLSRREKEVLAGILDNLSNKEIGCKLNISERTVKFHVSNLLQKFAVRRRADLIIAAYQESESKAPASGAVSAPTRVQ